MPDLGTDPQGGVVEPGEHHRARLTESDKFFDVERREEFRKRFATYALWAGLVSILLLLVPNPVPWLAGPVAIVLGIHALLRIRLQPEQHAGTARALVGMVIGLLATLACRWWLD